jgi:fructuronate reductase
MDGSQKLPQRLLGTLRDRLRANAPIERLALGVAAWLQFLRGVDEAGQRYEIADPLAAELAQRVALAASGADEKRRVASLCGFAPVFGELGGDPRFVGAVAQHTAALRAHGVRAVLASLA